MSARTVDTWRLVLPKPPYDPGIEAGTGGDKRRIAGFYGPRDEAERNARMCLAAPAALRRLLDVVVGMDADIQEERPDEDVYRNAVRGAANALGVELPQALLDVWAKS